LKKQCARYSSTEEIIVAGSPSLADWITASSTAVTAVATAVAGFIAWLAFRRDARSSPPIVETNIKWADKKLERYIEFRPLIRNQLYETITLDSVKILRPRAARVAKPILGDFYRDVIGLEKSGDRILPVALLRPPIA
jgi:hypothetical protein